MFIAVLYFLNTCLMTVHTYRPRYIQVVLRLVDITAGGDFLGPCDQKSSYKHVSDFGRLRSYWPFLIPHTPLCEPRLTEPAGG